VFYDISVFKSVREPAWLLGSLDTLCPTVIQGRNFKNSLEEAAILKAGGNRLHQLALVA
jgi:hypothetical protein